MTVPLPVSSDNSVMGLKPITGVIGQVISTTLHLSAISGLAIMKFYPLYLVCSMVIGKTFNNATKQVIGVTFSWMIRQLNLRVH